MSVPPPGPPEEELELAQEPGWTSNADAAGVASRLRAASRVVVTTHAKPDGDAVGSTLALVHALRAINIEATAVYIGPWSDRFNFLAEDAPVIHREPTESPTDREEQLFASADCIAITDTGSWSQLEAVRTHIQGRSDQTIIVDHHGHGDEAVADLRWIETRAAAACEMIAEVCARLLNSKSPAQLPEQIATCLYLGIATDTGWFRFSNVTSNTFRTAADLIDAGTNADAIYQQTELTDSPQRLLIMRSALNSLRLENNNEFAVMSLRLRDFEEAGASRDDYGGIVDIPKTVGSVKVVALALEAPDGRTKLSLRSKAGAGSVDVNRVAQTFGGGGHKHAAGARTELPLEQTIEKLIEVVANAERLA